MRLIQISDLHLPAARGELTAGTDTFALLDRLLDDLRQQESDLLVVTGDVCGDTESAFCYEYVRAALESFPCPWLALPGNHDRGRLFKEVLMAHALTGFVSYESPANTGLTFFDTSGETADTDGLKELENHLVNARGPQCLFTHYPPVLVGHPSYDGKHRLPWQEAFLETLTKSACPLHVFFGHIHYEFQATIDRLHLYSVPSATIPTIPGRGADLPDPAGPCYRRIDVSPDGVRTAVYRLDDVGGRPASRVARGRAHR